MREWITGRNPVFEALTAYRRQFFRLQIARGVEVKGKLAEILQLAKEHKLQVEQVGREVIERMSADNNQGVALELNDYPYVELQDILDHAARKQEPLFVLVLDVIQNPQNLGSLLRTAEAVGVHGVLLPLRRAAGVTPAVVHASAGASEHMLIAQANLAQSLEVLKQAGAWIIGLEGGPEAQPIEQIRLDGPLALVVGSEGEGMRLLVSKSCDALVRLPMLGRIESLNAAVAGSVVLYMALQARQKHT